MSQFQFSRPDSLTPIVKNLIIINVLVFVAQLLLDNQFDITNKFALYPLHSPQFQPYQIATHMFTHGGIMHLLFNMFSLYTFGRRLEASWGPQRFLLSYFACGIGAAAAHLGIQAFRWSEVVELSNKGNQVAAQIAADRIAAAIGASGATVGLMTAYGYLFPNTQFMLMFPPIPLKAKWMVIGLILGDLFGAFSPVRDGIAHFAHLGGALTGFIIVLIWNKTGRRRFY